MATGFIFNYTCPIINENLDKIEDNIYDDVSSFLIDQFPILSYHEVPLKALSSDLTQTIFDNIKSEIEEVRSCNTDMRNAAEDQIIGLEETIADLETEITNLKNIIKDMENENLE